VGEEQNKLFEKILFFGGSRTIKFLPLLKGKKKRKIKWFRGEKKIIGFNYSNTTL
jgi:hypothetical protein